MTITASTETITFATVKTDYLDSLRPAPTRDAAFWTGGADERTFIVARRRPEMPFLVVNSSDPRSEGMRIPGQGEGEIIREMGMDPSAHRIWSIPEENLDFREDDTPTAPENPENPEVTRLRSEVEMLQAEATRLREHISNISSRHSRDIALIGGVLQEEAENRDWCSDYDDIVDRLNSDLHVELPVRETEHEVEVTGTVTVSFSTYISLTARANADEDDLQEQAQDLLTEGGYDRLSDFGLDGSCTVDDVTFH